MKKTIKNLSILVLFTALSLKANAFVTGDGKQDPPPEKEPTIIEMIISIFTGSGTNGG